MLAFLELQCICLIQNEHGILASLSLACRSAFLHSRSNQFASACFLFVYLILCSVALLSWLSILLRFVLFVLEYLCCFFAVRSVGCNSDLVPSWYWIFSCASNPSPISHFCFPDLWLQQENLSSPSLTRALRTENFYRISVRIVQLNIRFCSLACAHS